MTKQKVFKINPNNRVMLAYVVDSLYFRCKDSSGNVTEILCEDVTKDRVFNHKEIIPTW